MRPEGLCPMIPSRIEPATFRLVAQCLNQLRHRVPPDGQCTTKNIVPLSDMPSSNLYQWPAVVHAVVMLGVTSNLRTFLAK